MQLGQHAVLPLPRCGGGLEFGSAFSGELFAAGAEEFAHARAQVIKCSGSAHKVSVKPTLDHQGLLFWALLHQLHRSTQHVI